MSIKFSSHSRGRILSAYGSNVLAVLSGLLTNLWLLRKITELLPAEQFGIYAYVLQITSYLSILQLGVDFAASREIAGDIGRGDLDGARRSYRSLVRINRRLAAICLVAVGGLLALLQFGLGIPKEDLRVATVVACLTGSVQMVAFLQRPFSAALIGSRRQTFVNLLTGVRTICTTVLSYSLVAHGFGVKSIPFADLLLQLTALAVLAYGIKRLPVAQPLRGVQSDPAKTRHLFRFGGLVMVGGLAWTAESTADTIILGYTFGPVVVAAYVLWWRFPQMIFDLCTRLTTSAFPEFAHQRNASPDTAPLLFQKMAYAVAGLASLALVGIGLWLPSFMNLWLGGRYSLPSGGSVARAMAALIFLRVMGNFFGMFWLATRDARLTTKLAIAQAVLKIILGVAVAHQGIAALVSVSCISAAIQVTAIGFALLRDYQLTARFAMHLAILGGTAAALTAASAAFSINRIFPFALGIVATVSVWLAFWLVFARRGEIAPTLIALRDQWRRRSSPALSEI